MGSARIFFLNGVLEMMSGARKSTVRPAHQRGVITQSGQGAHRALELNRLGNSG